MEYRVKLAHLAGVPPDKMEDWIGGMSPELFNLYVEAAFEDPTVLAMHGLTRKE